MQMITTSRGLTAEVKFIGEVLRNGSRMMIELIDDRPFAEVAADFDGLESITKTDDILPGNETVFRGFTKLVGMARNTADDNAVRLTLERDDEA